MCQLHVYRVYLLCLSQSSGPANKKGTQPKLRPHTVFSVSIKFSNEIRGVCFYPALPCFLRHDIFFLFVASVSRQMVNRSFLLLREVYFVAEGKSLQAWIYFFAWWEHSFLMWRVLSFDGVVLYSLYALVVGIAHLSQCNKGLKIVWIKTKLAAFADNSHFSFLSERQLPCLADTGSVLPAAVFNPPCRGISTFHICHGTLQSLRCMAASRFLMSPLRAVPSSSEKRLPCLKNPCRAVYSAETGTPYIY